MSTKLLLVLIKPNYRELFKHAKINLNTNLLKFNSMIKFLRTSQLTNWDNQIKQPVNASGMMSPKVIRGNEISMTMNITILTCIFSKIFTIWQILHQIKKEKDNSSYIRPFITAYWDVIIDVCMNWSRRTKKTAINFLRWGKIYRNKLGNKEKNWNLSSERGQNSFLCRLS